MEGGLKERKKTRRKEGRKERKKERKKKKKKQKKKKKKKKKKKNKKKGILLLKFNIPVTSFCVCVCADPGCKHNSVINHSPSRRVEETCSFEGTDLQGAVTVSFRHAALSKDFNVHQTTGYTLRRLSCIIVALG